MQSVKPVYLVALALVLALVVYWKLSNPYRQFSTQQFWKRATVENVSDIPAEALKPGNKNGGILMWAATGTSDPSILEALVNKGADINEADPLFSGTPLTSAATYTDNPKIIRALMDLGADMEIRVMQGNTALMVAAMYNPNVGIIDVLIEQGANPEAKNNLGQTAFDLARSSENSIAIDALSAAAKSK